MPIYIWLKQDVGEKVEVLYAHGGRREWDVHTQDGAKYLFIHEDVFDPTANIPTVPSDFIEKVTMRCLKDSETGTDGVDECA